MEHFMPTEKLAGFQNYHTWSCAAKAYLQLSDLWECIEPTENFNSNTLQKKEEKAMSTLILLVDPVNYIHIRHCKSAKEIWDTLERTFRDSGLQAKVNLLKELIKTTLENSNSMDEYINKVMDIGSKLKNIGFIDDEWLGVYMLTGLPDEYKHVIIDIESSGVKVSADLIKITILHNAGTLQKRLPANKRKIAKANGSNKNRKQQKTSQVEESYQIATTSTQPVQQDPVPDHYNNLYVNPEQTVHTANVDQSNLNPQQDATTSTVSQEVVIPKIEIKQEFSDENFQCRLGGKKEWRQAGDDILIIDSSDEEDSQITASGTNGPINGIQDEETLLIPIVTTAYSLHSAEPQTPFTPEEEDAVPDTPRAESPEWRPGKGDGFIRDYIPKPKLRSSRSQSVKTKNNGAKPATVGCRENNPKPKSRNYRSQSLIHKNEKPKKTSAVSQATDDRDSKLQSIIKHQSTFQRVVKTNSFSDLRGGLQDIRRPMTHMDLNKAKKASANNLNLIVNCKVNGTFYGRIPTSHILDVMKDILGQRIENLGKPIIRYIYCLTNIYIQHLGYRMVCTNISKKERFIDDSTVKVFINANNIDLDVEVLLKEAEQVPSAVISPDIVELVILRAFLVMAAPKCVSDAENMINSVETDQAYSQLMMNIFTLARMTDAFKRIIRAVAIRFLRDVANRIQIARDDFTKRKLSSVSRSQLQLIIRSNNPIYRKFLFEQFISDEIDNNDMNYETDS